MTKEPIRFSHQVRCFRVADEVYERMSNKKKDFRSWNLFFRNLIDKYEKEKN